MNAPITDLVSLFYVKTLGNVPLSLFMTILNSILEWIIWKLLKLLKWNKN